MVLPDVQGDGNDRVEHDGIGEEDENRDDGNGTGPCVATDDFVDERVPRLDNRELDANLTFPYSASNCANSAHRQQEDNDLQVYTL